MSDEADMGLQAFKDAILFLANEMEANKKRLDMLEDLLCNQVIGGIKGLYDQGVRDQGISSLKAKYGEKISPFEGALSELGTTDWSSELYDHLQSKRSGATEESPWGDEQDDGEVQALLDALQAKLDKIKSAGVKPESVEVEVAAPAAEAEPAAESSGPDDDLIETINRMKGRTAKK